jgi:hypothetical protein
MKIYHSFWEGGYRVMDHHLYNMHKLSVLTALKNYGNIHLITTKTGKEFLKDLPYTSIEFFEDNINTDYWRIWAISKLYAYRQIIRKNEPFLHIDYDVFLFKKLPENILSGGTIFQNKEGEHCIRGSYDYDNFVNKCKYKPLFSKDVMFAYNVGVFGGNNIDVLKFAVDNIFDLIFHEDNKDFFLKDSLNISWAYSVLTEQLYLAMCLDHLGVKPSLIFPNDDFDRISKELGYTHLMGRKNEKEVTEKVVKKIEEELLNS